jgi:hypothetical protein
MDPRHSNGSAKRRATERTGAWGAAAGGNLARMLGLTNGARELEGTAGGRSDETGSVQASGAWFRRPTSCAPTRTAARRAAAALHHRAGAAGAVD